jgi:protein-tyrosine phosphatase
MTFSFLNRKTELPAARSRPLTPIRVDVHAHLLPGLDNSATRLEASVRMARGLVEAGIARVVTTPHVMQGYYDNTLERISEARQELETELRKRNIPLELDIAAEYYAGQELLATVEQPQHPLLTFGARGRRPYLLLETGLLQEPDELEPLVTSLLARNITPLLAHPERYLYLQRNFERAIELFRLGLHFQVDWQSFHAGEERSVRALAERLVDYRMVSFAGTNLRSAEQLPRLREAARQPYFRLMTEIGLQNNQLH